MMKRQTLRPDSLNCPFDEQPKVLFFSLVDYRNNYFTSNDPEKIIEFYNGFGNRNQLIQWMRDRPKGITRITEVLGNKEVIVVIPTGDINGKFAKECRDNIFKGLHMVFVQSVVIPDFYFNFAHYVNVGITRAMEYNPKWIVISGDDMVKIDDVSKLIDQLDQIKDKNAKAVFTNESIYHSKPMYLSTPRRSFDLILTFLSKFSSKWKYKNEVLGALRRFNSQNVYYPINGSYLRDRSVPLSSLVNTSRRLFEFLCFKKLFSFINMLDFLIIRGTYAKESGRDLFDETYVNEMEDTDLSISLCRNRTNYVFIDYRIGDYIGSTLGNGIPRECRVVPGYTYFSEKMKNDYALNIY